jgi:hypothetical protein
MKILISTLLYLLAQTLVWFQLYGPIKIPWFKSNQWMIYVLAIPTTYLFSQGTKIGYEAFGEAWPLRFLGFSMGILSFAFLTNYFMEEGINLKSIVCVILSLLIVIIQIMWK